MLCYSVLHFVIPFSDGEKWGSILTHSFNPQSPPAQFITNLKLLTQPFYCMDTFHLPMVQSDNPISCHHPPSGPSLYANPNSPIPHWPLFSPDTFLTTLKLHYACGVLSSCWLDNRTSSLGQLVGQLRLMLLTELLKIRQGKRKWQAETALKIMSYFFQKLKFFPLILSFTLQQSHKCRL